MKKEDRGGSFIDPLIAGSKVRSADLAQMLVGALALAFPVAVTEEVWDLGSELSWPRIIMLQVGSILILGWYGSHAFHGGQIRKNLGDFITRLLIVYLMTVALSAMLLFLIDKWPITTDTGVAIRRTVIVAFPAVFSATIVDSLN
jgi:uncharacterized membrane protein